MIQPNELRIGNWVIDNEGVPVKLSGMRPYDDSTRCDGDGGCILLFDKYGRDMEEDSPNCRPIPLTPEILENAGFAKGCPYSDDYGFTAPDNALFFEKDFSPLEMSSGRGFGIELTSLHQLQNLYFALTGEELTINL